MVTTRYSETNRDPNRDETLWDSTSNGTDQCQNGSSSLLKCSIPRVTSIDSDCCRLPTISVLNNKADKIAVESVLINKNKFLKIIHRTITRKIEIPGSMVVEALSW